MEGGVDGNVSINAEAEAVFEASPHSNRDLKARIFLIPLHLLGLPAIELSDQIHIRPSICFLREQDRHFRELTLIRKILHLDLRPVRKLLPLFSSRILLLLLLRLFPGDLCLFCC